MDGVPPFVEDPSDTREAIMAATYVALRTHGYADLTIAKIGQAFEKSKSLLYHHYDSKDELLLEFLEFMLERFEDAVPFELDGTAEEHLDAVLDYVLSAPEGAAGFNRAMSELRAQAAHDPAYRDHFTRSDRFFRERLADLVRSGVEEGVFREVDPEATAAFLHALFVGALLQRATTDEPTDAVRQEADAYVRTMLLADGAVEDVGERA